MQVFSGSSKDTGAPCVGTIDRRDSGLNRPHRKSVVLTKKPRLWLVYQRRGFSTSPRVAHAHQELLAMDGLYRRLYELQYAEQVPLPGGDGAANGREGVEREAA